MREFGVDKILAKRIVEFVKLALNENKRVIDELESENTRLRRENARLSEEAARWERENAGLRYENARLSEKARRLENENAELAERDDERLNKILELISHIGRLESMVAGNTEGYPDVQDPRRRAPEDMYTTGNDLFDRYSAGGIEPVDDPTPHQSNLLDSLLSSIGNNDSTSPHRDGHRRNAPEPTRNSGKRNPGRSGSLSSDAGSMKRDIFGRRKKR